MNRFFVFLAFTLLVLTAKAQSQNAPCVDSNRVDPWFQCNDPNFEPVCGCDRKTYRNECVAFRNHGVNEISSDGVCQESYFFWFIYPNISTDYMQFNLQFYDRGNVTIEIRDSYGKLMFYRNAASVTELELPIELAGYRQGVYIIMVYSRSAGKYEYKRFIRI